jgi:hypothetical protein
MDRTVAYCNVCEEFLHVDTLNIFQSITISEIKYHCKVCVYEGVSKSFRTGLLERELQMIQLSANRYSCIAIL